MRAASIVPLVLESVPDKIYSRSEYRYAII